MTRFHAVPTRLVGALVGLYAVAALAAGETWNPVSATRGQVPLPNKVTWQDSRYEGTAYFQYYQYAPSVVQLSATQRILYYCANTVSGETDDHIAFNVGNLQSDGSYAWGDTLVALSPKDPTTPSWASRHICDPEVVRGSFQYGLRTQPYTWAMFFTAANDDTTDSRFNIIGVAYADAPEGPWVIAADPLIDHREPGYDISWGVGQPSVTSIDGAGKVLLFYSGVSASIARREVDLGNANIPVLGARVFLPLDGLTPEPAGGVFFHNASFVYDSSRGEFFVSRDTGPWNDRVQEAVEVARISGGSIWSGVGTWTVAGRVSSCQTGYPYNTNSGLVRNPWGGLASSDALEVYFATEPAGAGYYAYRLWRVAAPLTFRSSERPELAIESDGSLSLFGLTHDTCGANVWATNQPVAGGGFEPWVRFGASPAGRPVAARMGDGRVALFARADDGSLWWAAQVSPGGPYGGWVRMQSSPYDLVSDSPPAVGVMSDGRLVVAIRRNLGAQGHHMLATTQMTVGGEYFNIAWTDLGPSPAGNPVFAANQDGTLVLFARAASDAGGQIWFNTRAPANTHGWSGWQPVEGSGAAMAFEGTPAVARQADGRLVVVARRAEGPLSVAYVNVQSAPDVASFSPVWTSLGASPEGDPVLATQTQGRLALIARAGNGNVWWRHQDVPNGPFHGWDSLAGVIAGTPVAAMRQDGRLTIVGRYPDGRFIQTVQLSPGSSDFTNWALIQ